MMAQSVEMQSNVSKMSLTDIKMSMNVEYLNDIFHLSRVVIYYMH